jgi:hypothetical protein
MDSVQREKTQSRITLHALPVMVRVLFSFFLLTIGLGYLLALFYLFLVVHQISTHFRLYRHRWRDPHGHGYGSPDFYIAV